MNIKIATQSLMSAAVALFAAQVTSGKVYNLEILNINYSDTDASGLNNNAQIVGTAYNGTGTQTVAYRYDSLTKTYSVVVPPLSFMKPAEMVGSAINDAGTITGTYSHAPSLADNAIQHTGFCTEANGSSFSVDNYGDDQDHTAVAIMNNGLILETARLFPTSTGTWTSLHNELGANLGSFPLGFVATGMNDSLVFSGNDFGFGATIFNFTTKQKIRLLGNVITEGWPHASAINKLSVVAGMVVLSNNDTRGFLTNGYWHSLFGSNIASVNAINNVSNVVGQLNNNSPFYYERSTGYFLDLNKQLSQTVWILRTATGINDFGQICGQAFRAARFGEPSEGGFIYKAYLLTPVTIGGVFKQNPNPPGQE